MATTIEYLWRGDISDAELVALTDSYGGNSEAGWWDRIRPFSLGWVTGRLANGDAAAFVNVAWDGGDHAFLIDTKVRSDLQRQGIGTELVRIATDHARRAGCEWLHVDYDDRERLEPFYVGACGFRPTPAALIRLHDGRLENARPPPTTPYGFRSGPWQSDGARQRSRSMSATPAARGPKPLPLILARELASNLATPMFLLDADGMLVFYNDAAEQLIGKPFSELGEIPAGEFGAVMQLATPDGEPVKRRDTPSGLAFFERRPAHKTLLATGYDGVRRTVEATAYPLFGVVGEMCGVVSVFWEHSGSTEPEL